MAIGGIILNDSRVTTLEKKKHDDEACVEIEAAHPGYLSSLDTFYVANLYITKTPITAADRLTTKYFHLLSSVAANVAYFNGQGCSVLR